MVNDEVTKNYIYNYDDPEDGYDDYKLTKRSFTCKLCGRRVLRTKPTTLQGLVQQMDEVEVILNLHLMMCDEYLKQYPIKVKDENVTQGC